MSEYAFREPVDPRLPCRNCADPILATAVVYGENLISISGLNEYRWVHAVNGAVECPPPCPPPTAQPYDDWEATRCVERIREERFREEPFL